MSTPTHLFGIHEIERFCYVSTPDPESVIPVEGEDRLCEHPCSCVYCVLLV